MKSSVSNVISSMRKKNDIMVFLYRRLPASLEKPKKSRKRLYHKWHQKQVSSLKKKSYSFTFNTFTRTYVLIYTETNNFAVTDKKTNIRTENNSAGTSDKSLRMLEKDLQELKRVNKYTI